MKCLFFFGISSMKEGTPAQLIGRGELHGGLGLQPELLEKVYFRLLKKEKNS